MLVFRLSPISAAVLWLLTPEFLVFVGLAVTMALNPEQAAFFRQLLG